jgi:hypothetical protein
VRTARRSVHPLLALGWLALLGGCGSAVAPRCGPVAPALRAAAVALAVVRIPVLLPNVLPGPPPESRYEVAVQRAPTWYAVTFAWTGASGTAPEAATLGCVQGERRGEHLLGCVGDVASLARLTGRRAVVGLPGGGEGALFRSEGVAWSEGGWRYVVVDRIDASRGLAPLLPYVERIRRELPPWGNPVGPGTSGLLVQSVGPSAADIRLQWVQGDATYAVWGHVASGIALARSLVCVPRETVRTRG